MVHARACWIGFQNSNGYVNVSHCYVIGLHILPFLFLLGPFFSMKCYSERLIDCTCCYSLLYICVKLTFRCHELQVYELRERFPCIFLSVQVMFADAVHRLTCLLDYPSATIPLQARNIFCTLLINTGLFEGDPSEVFVWLHCYLAVPADHRKSVARLLIDAVVRASQNPATYIDFIVQCEEAAEDTKQILDSSRLEDVFDGEDK